MPREVWREQEREQSNTCQAGVLKGMLLWFSPSPVQQSHSGGNSHAPYGTRTRVSALRGPRPRPLDERG